MKVIVLEGHDLAGKSTLADELAKHHRARAGYSSVTEWHYGPFTEDHSALDEYLVPLQAWVSSATADDVLIIDRFHLGEAVYGPLLRGESKLAWWQAMIIEDYLTEIGATRIMVHASSENIVQERYEKRYESLPLGKVLDARTRYIDLLNRMPIDRRRKWTVWSEQTIGALLP